MAPCRCVHQAEGVSQEWRKKHPASCKKENGHLQRLTSNSATAWNLLRQVLVSAMNVVGSWGVGHAAARGRALGRR